VENDPQQTHEHLPRGAKAVIDARAATRLSAVVGDGEFAEFAVAVEEVAATGRAATAAAVMRRTAPVAAIGAATLACLWAGARMNHNFSDMAAHAAADGGSFGRLNAAASPMFGAGRDRGELSGDPAMNLKNSARVAAMAVTAAVTANGALAGDAVQWRVEDGGNGHWYGISASATTWATASASARSAGAWLADIEADQEGVFIASLWAMFGLTDGAWAGGYQANESCGPNCGWAWSSGKAWGYTNWYANEPNDVSGPESRLEILPVNSLPQWFDAPDSQSYLRRAVIEWSADCNSDGIVDYGQCHDGTLPDYNGNNIPDCCEQGMQCTVRNYPVQWRVEDGGNGHWYLAVHPSPMPTTFAAQDAFADSVGAHMATLTSSGENALAISLLSGAAGETNGAHFGLRRVGNTTSWQWVGGEQLTWDFWGSIFCSGGPYPNNSGTRGEMGAMLYKQNCGWVWDDAWPSYYAGEVTLMLLIEWSADCNNDNIVDYGQILNGQLADTNTNNIPDCCEPGNSCCLGDIYVNHIVDGGDLGVLLSEWGVVTPTTRSDLNRDGFVDGADLGRLLANWGPCGG
jgi:hypothetical protein